MFKMAELPGTVSPITSTPGMANFVKTTKDLSLSGVTAGTSINIHGFDYVVREVTPKVNITTYGATLQESG